MSFWPPSWTSIDRKILDMALPNIVSNMSTPLIGLVDTFVAGHLGSTEELAGIAVGVSAFYLLYNVFVFLRKGTTGLTAQARGAGDFVEVRASFARPFLFALLTGALITAFSGRIMEAIFLWIEPPDEGTRAAARAYIAARVLGAPFALANYAVQGWLNGMQRSANVLVQNMILNVSNAALCVLLALDLGGWGMGLGVVGIGYAAALANAIAMAAGLVNVASCVNGGLLGGGRPMAGRWSWAALWDASAVVDFLTLGSTITIRSLLLTLMQTYFTGNAASFGSTTLAADQLLLQLQSLVSSGTDGFSNAAEALVGEVRQAGRQAGRQSVSQLVSQSVSHSVTQSISHSVTQSSQVRQPNNNKNNKNRVV